MFGNKLRPEAIKLLTEIEQHFGKEISERSLEDPSRFAVAGIDSDGTPYVAINRAKDVKEGIIVHELFHLKLWAQGYPSITFEYPSVLDVSEAYANWIWAHLYDPIEHSIFYPSIRNMGLDPGAEHRTAFGEALAKGDYLDLSPPLEDEGRALHYVEAALHINDQDFLHRVRRWYKANQWDSSLDKGEKIVEMIKQQKSITPQSIIPIFVKCLNVLKHGIVKFELNRWEHRPKGSHTEPVAVIRILPNTW